MIHMKNLEKKTKKRNPFNEGFQTMGDDRFFDVSEYPSDEPSDQNSFQDAGVRFIPVSLLSTPPTITTTDRPYGEIVNKDFYDLSTRGKKHQTETRDHNTSLNNHLHLIRIHLDWREYLDPADQKLRNLQDMLFNFKARRAVLGHQVTTNTMEKAGRLSTEKNP